jgi:hypothetical protein
MKGAHIRVLKKTNQVRLGSFLKSQKCCTLKLQVHVDFLSNFPYKPLER